MKVVKVTPNSSEAKELCRWINNRADYTNKAKFSGTSRYYTIHSPYRCNLRLSELSKDAEVITFEQWKRLTTISEGMQRIVDAARKSISELPSAQIVPEKKVVAYKLKAAYPGCKVTVGDTVSPDSLFAKSYHPEDYPHLWEPVYEKEPVKYKVKQTSGETFNIQISEKGIFHESFRLNIDDLKRTVITGTDIRHNGPFGCYPVRFTHANIGCKEGVAITDIAEILRIYDSFNR